MAGGIGLSLAVLACALPIAFSASQADVDAYLASDAFLNYTRAFMDATNTTSFSSCGPRPYVAGLTGWLAGLNTDSFYDSPPDEPCSESDRDANGTCVFGPYIGANTVQGFVPCPYPYGGVGTYENPALGCSSRGVWNDGGVLGSTVLAVIFVPVNLITAALCAKRIFPRLVGTLQRSDDKRKRLNKMDNLDILNIGMLVAMAVYSLDPDGRRGWMQFGVSNFFLHMGLFCIQCLLYQFTNTIVAGLESMKYRGAEPPKWRNAKYAFAFLSFYWNMVNPFIEITTGPDDYLIAPVFGSAHAFNYLGWNNKLPRALRFCALFVLLNTYAAACTIKVQSLADNFKVEKDPKKVLTASAKDRKKEEAGHQLYLRLKKQQRASQLLCFLAGTFFLTNVPGSFGSFHYRITTLPCSFIGGVLDIPMTIMTIAGVTVYNIMGVKKKKGPSKVSSSSSSSSSSAASS